MQRIKRIITITAISAVAAASVPAIAAAAPITGSGLTRSVSATTAVADTNTGSGSGSGTKQQYCGAVQDLVNTTVQLGMAAGGYGTAAGQATLKLAGAIYDAGLSAGCGQ